VWETLDLEVTRQVGFESIDLIGGHDDVQILCHDRGGIALTPDPPTTQ
jgi:hypothetical protein